MDPTSWRTLVTGASSGIGEEYARRLRARGHSLVLVARRRERLERLASELGGEPHAIVETCDLSEEGSAEWLQVRLGEREIAIDGLVNCAGLGLTGPFTDQSRELVRAMCNVNVRALVELTHALLPPMLERRRGFVMNVASNAAFQPIPYLAVYAATKSFVLSFTEALHDELKGTGVHALAVCPGLTATEFLDVSHTGAELKVRRMPTMTPRDVVDASLAALDARRTRVVVGLTNRVLGFLSQRVAPAALARRVSGELYRPVERK